MALHTRILRSRVRAGVFVALLASTVVAGSGGWQRGTADASTPAASAWMQHGSVGVAQGVGSASAAPDQLPTSVGTPAPPGPTRTFAGTTPAGPARVARTPAVPFGSSLKPVNRGLMMRGGQPPPASLEGVVHGYVVYLSWRSVQPNGPNDFATKYIDGMIGAVRAWNAAHPGNQPQGLRVRVFAGVYSPAWVLAMSGGPVTVSGPNGQHGTVPRWWTQPVVDAYTAFIAKLAAHIDSVPEVREVTVGLTMEFYGEIFQRYDMPALQAAGFTEALDIAAIQASFRAHAAFRHTTTQVDVDGYPVWSQYAITAQLMGYARSVLASVQFANAALKETNGGPLYTLMQSFGARGKSGGPTCHLTFQTLPVVGNITTVINRAISYGATSVELPTGLGSASVLAPLDVALQGNG